MNEESAKVALAGAGWLATEPAWLRNEFLACARIRKFQNGEYAYHLDDEPGGMFGIASGGFGVVVPSGAEMTLCHVLWQGAWFGAGPILTNGRRTLGFRAVETSRALVVSLRDLNAIGTRHPELYRRIGALSEQSMQSIATRIVGDLLITSGERRIAAVLARLASGNTGGQVVTLGLSQAVIGQMSNSSRDRVNRTLNKFAKAGWIELGYQAVKIVEPSALERFSRNSR